LPDQSSRIPFLLGGFALVAHGAIRRGIHGLSSAVFGCALLAMTPDGEGRHSTAMPVRIRWRTTVPKPPAEAWQFWSNLEHLPAFVPGLVSVTALDHLHHEWTAGGGALRWRSVTVDARPGERLAWQAVPGSSVLCAGHIQLQGRRNGRETRVRLDAWYLALPAVVAAATPDEPVHNVLVHDVLERSKRRFDRVS
jgi:uncharacterized membrane protein